MAIQEVIQIKNMIKHRSEKESRLHERLKPDCGCLHCTGLRRKVLEDHHWIQLHQEFDR